MSNPIFISAINEALTGIFDKYAGVKIYGLAETIVKKYADSEEYLPAIVDVPEGEAKYVGIDDTNSITIYHKSNSISISDKQNSGYGVVKAFKNYSYANVMVIAFNGSIVKCTQDEMMLLIEVNLPEELKIKNYRQVILKTESCVLNSLSVFNSEYKGNESGIPLNFRLMAIYYRVDSLFDKSCFPKC